jgi:endo-1,4-beta-D-glucanase Y
MSKRVPQLLVALVFLFGVIAIGFGIRSDHRGPVSSTTTPGGTSVLTTAQPGLTPLDAAMASATSFLDRFVDENGRVQREPEGDTVSEGQAYAMLLAVAVGDQTRFDLIWNWTRLNLLGDDGSLAWHWSDGAVIDHNAATDADLDAARALALAADRFGLPAYRADAASLAAALMEHEVLDVAGAPVLIAGPWADELPYVVNPSYYSPVAFDLLALSTGDARWTAVHTAGTSLLESTTDDGRSLPSDWAEVDAGGVARPAPAPNGQAIGYGYEAFRALPRLVESCDAEDRALAAALWQPVAKTLDEPAATSNLDGTEQSSGDNPLFLLAGAAAAHTTGDAALSDELADRAEQLERESPSYYLAAWVALTRVLLDTDLLGGCALATAGS